MLPVMSIDATELAATAIGTVVVTVGTVALWLSARHSQRDHEIEQAVNAQISVHLHHFLDLSERSRSLVERTEDIQREADEIQSAIRSDKSELATDRAKLVELQTQLVDLRSRWGKLVPTMESIEESPELLQITAEQKLELARTADDAIEQQDALREANAYLRRLLDHPDAETKDLQAGGNLARDFLRMPTLARQLYERSLTVDPSNVQTRAELASLRTRQPSERQAALDELMGLMTEHPEAKNARFSLFNHFMDLSRWDDLANACRKIIESDDKDVTAWRNLGVALESLGEKDEARAAYETSLDLARQFGEFGDIGNTARPFAALLRKEGSKASIDFALKILEEGLREHALDAKVHNSMGETLVAAGKPAEALRYFKMAENLGSPPEKALARRQIQQLVVLQQIGLLPSNEHFAATMPEAGH
jgi:tetratricopeptide (TPR) repeat protein